MLFGAILAASVPILACSAPPPDDGSAGLEEADTAEVASPLSNNGGGSGNGLTAGECTSCGCTLVFDHKTDTCRYYKCVCDSEAKAKCVTGSKAASLVSVPISPRPIVLGAAAPSSVLTAP
jgi:hypothetical protein